MPQVSASRRCGANQSRHSIQRRSTREIWTRTVRVSVISARPTCGLTWRPRTTRSRDAPMGLPRSHKRAHSRIRSRCPAPTVPAYASRSSRIPLAANAHLADVAQRSRHRVRAHAAFIAEVRIPTRCSLVHQQRQDPQPVHHLVPFPVSHPRLMQPIMRHSSARSRGISSHAQINLCHLTSSSRQEPCQAQAMR